MIHTIVFDIGNVLVDYDPMIGIRRFFQDEEVIRRVFHAVWESGCWSDMDRGMDAKAVLPRMLEIEPEYQDEIRTIIDHAGSTIVRRAYAIPWIQKWKAAGYRVLYLSNYSRQVMNTNRAALDFLPYMDGGVFSCEIGCVKPDPEMYRTLCTRYTLDPTCCVFLDDSAENLKGAETFGMKTIQVRNYEQVDEELSALLQSRISPKF